MIRLPASDIAPEQEDSLLDAIFDATAAVPVAPPVVKAIKAPVVIPMAVKRPIVIPMGKPAAKAGGIVTPTWRILPGGEWAVHSPDSQEGDWVSVLSKSTGKVRRVLLGAPARTPKGERVFRPVDTRRRKRARKVAPAATCKLGCGRTRANAAPGCRF